MAADLPGLAAALWLVAELAGIPGLILGPADIRRSVAAEPDASAGRRRSPDQGDDRYLGPGAGVRARLAVQ
jgi:hypothetical protein